MSVNRFIGASFTRTDGFVRVGSVAIVLKHKSQRALFSERHGYRRFYRIGFGWRIGVHRDRPSSAATEV